MVRFKLIARINHHLTDLLKVVALPFKIKKIKPCEACRFGLVTTHLHGVCIFGKILHLFHSFSVSVSCHIIDDKDLLFELCTFSRFPNDSTLNFLEFGARPNLPGRWFLKQRELARLGCWTTCVTKMRSQSLRVPAKKWDSVVWHGLGTSNGDSNADFPYKPNCKSMHVLLLAVSEWPIFTATVNSFSTPVVLNSKFILELPSSIMLGNHLVTIRDVIHT